MDLGSIASIVQLITAGVSLIVFLGKKIHSLHNAPRHVQELWEEFDIAQRFLYFVQYTLEDVQIPIDHHLSSITELQTRTETFNNELQHMIAGFENEDGTIHALRWFNDETKCRELKDRVKRHYEEISRLVQLFLL
jgi:hypothetical protein